MGQRNSRRFFNFIVDNDLQLRIMAYSIIYMICGTLVIIAVVSYPLINDMNFSNDLEIQYVAAQYFLIIAKRIVPALIAIFVLFTLHQLIITHRICGPLVNFTNTFARIADGDLNQKVHLRKHDYLKEECDHINEMITGLANIIEHVRVDHNNLRANLESISIDINDQAIKEKINSSLEIIKSDAEYVSKRLAYFKTSEKISLREE
jgi:methyl-accepting chemotaxis protein